MYLVLLCQASSDVKTAPALKCLTEAAVGPRIPSTAQSLCYLHRHVKSIHHFPVYWHDNSYGCNEQWCDAGITEELKTGLLDETTLPACQPSLSWLLLLTRACLFLLIVCGLCHFETYTVDAKCLFQPVSVKCKDEERHCVMVGYHLFITSVITDA